MYQPWNKFLAVIAEDEKMSAWLNVLPKQLDDFLNSSEGELFKGYIKLFQRTEVFQTSSLNLNKDYVRFGSGESVTLRQQDMIHQLFIEMMPWRKGPYEFFGQKVESEWLSFKKWDRLLPFLSPLNNRNVLDVGCGNGYHMWRMLGEGANRVTGIDPCALFTAQFELFKRSIQSNVKDKINLLPLGIEDLPKLEAFDTVFSMGVLYHRRSAVDHLFQLHDQLVRGGELVLETLVVEGDENTILVPTDRYAKMPNVWYIPSTKALEKLILRCGFVDVKLVNVDMTTTAEQRQTELMRTESLQNFLDPQDPTKTIEGYQAPTRAVFIAHRKG